MESKKTIKQVLILSLVYVAVVLIFNFSIEKLFFTILSLFVVAPIMFVLLRVSSKTNSVAKNIQEKIKNPMLKKINKHGGYILLLLIIIAIIMGIYLLENSLG